MGGVTAKPGLRQELRQEQLQLQEEGGVTAISLENAALLIGRHGEPNLLKLWIDEEGEYCVTAEWPDDYKHTFTGFSWGYAGEGPHGLAEFAGVIGLGERLTMHAIATLPNAARPSDVIHDLRPWTVALLRKGRRTHGGPAEWIW